MFISVSTDALKMRTQELVMKQQRCSESDVVSILHNLSFILHFSTSSLLPSLEHFFFDWYLDILE